MSVEHSRMGEEGVRRGAPTSPEVLDWRLYKVESGLDHLEDRIGSVDVQIARHGERMQSLDDKVGGVDLKAGRIEQAVQRLEDQRFNNLWHLVLASATIIGTVIGSHFLIK